MNGIEKWREKKKNMETVIIENELILVVESGLRNMVEGTQIYNTESQARGNEIYELRIMIIPGISFK